MRGNKTSLAGISKQKYNIPPGLDNTPDCLGADIARKWVLAAGVRENVPGFFISKRDEK